MENKNDHGEVEIKWIWWGKIISSMWRISLQDWLYSTLLYSTLLYSTLLYFTLLYLKAFCFKSAKRVIKISRSYGRLYALHIPFSAIKKKDSVNDGSGKIQQMKAVAIDERDGVAIDERDGVAIDERGGVEGNNWREKRNLNLLKPEEESEAWK